MQSFDWPRGWNEGLEANLGNQTMAAVLEANAPPALVALTNLGSSSLWNSDYSGAVVFSGKSDYVALNFRGYMYFSERGWYNFQINSDDGSRLFVDNQEVVTYDGLHSAAEYVPGVYWNPTPGAWTMYELQYFEATGLAQLQLERKASTETAYLPVPLHQLRTSVRRKKLIKSALLGLAHVLRVFDNEANPLTTKLTHFLISQPIYSKL